jgi:hypothetical protein
VAAQKLLAATGAAFSVTGRPGYFTPELMAISDGLGLDPALIEGGWQTSLSFRWAISIRPAWGLHADLSVDFDPPHSPQVREDFLERLAVRLTWPSGGGRPTLAVAQAAQHLRLAHQAAQLQVIYEEAVQPPRRLSGNPAGDSLKVIGAALTRLYEMREEAWAAIRAELPEEGK